MKIGLVANCFKEKSWEEACRLTKEAGLEAIEPASGGYDGKAHCDPEALLKDESALDKFKKTADKYGLEIIAFGCKGNALHPQKKIAQKDTADIENSIELAKKTGVKTIVVFAGTPGACENDSYPNWIVSRFPFELGDRVNWQWKEKIIPFWTDMIKKIKNTDIQFAFELHLGDCVYNPETFLKLREAVDSEKICCNLDPSHLFPQGIDIDVCMRKLGNTIVHVHAKDCKIEKPVADYRGLLDWKDFGQTLNRAWNYRTIGYGHSLEFWTNFISTLRLIGYDGVLSIEHEDPLMSDAEGLSKAMDFLKKIILYEKVGKMWWEK